MNSALPELLMERTAIALLLSNNVSLFNNYWLWKKFEVFSFDLGYFVSLRVTNNLP